MTTITKTALIAALALGLTSAAQAREGGTQPDLPGYNEPIAQQHVQTDNPRNAYAQQPRTRVAPRAVSPTRSFSDDPPGSAFQTWGNHEAQ